MTAIYAFNRKHPTVVYVASILAIFTAMALMAWARMLHAADLPVLDGDAPRLPKIPAEASALLGIIQTYGPVVLGILGTLGLYDAIRSLAKVIIAKIRSVVAKTPNKIDDKVLGPILDELDVIADHIDANRGDHAAAAVQEFKDKLPSLVATITTQLATDALNGGLSNVRKNAEAVGQMVTMTFKTPK